MKNKTNRPLLTGELTKQNGQIRGHWHFESQPCISSQTFEYSKRSTELEDPQTLNGEYTGYFVHELKDRNRKEVNTRIIKETNVVIEFDEQVIDGNTNLSIQGKGLNQYGIFELKGNAKQSSTNPDVYQISMYKLYVNPNGY